MNKKANIVFTFQAIIAFIVAGIVFFVVFPSLDVYRILLINNSGLDVGTKLIMYSFFPLVIGLWILIGIFVIRSATRGGFGE